MSENARAARTLWIVLGVSTAARLLLGAGLDLAPDEAYYWVWSRHFAPGYLDHPPLVAYLIAAGTQILGDTRLGVRLLAIACGTGTLYLFFDALRILFSARRAALATLALAVTPAAVAGGVLATPDAPLVLGWALTLRGLAGLEADARSRKTHLALVAAGTTVACLSKLTGLALLFLVAAWPLARAGVRGSRPRPGSCATGS